MSDLKLKIDQKKCTRCGECARDCPGDVLKMNDVPEVNSENVENCIECQHCFTVCPTGALSIFGLRSEDSAVLAELPSYQQMRTFVRGRRTVRNYVKENVDREKIDNLLKDLAHSPTGCNDRALVFSVIYERAKIDEYREKIFTEIDRAEKAGAKLSERPAAIRDAYRQQGADVLFRGAPHLLLVSLDLEKNPHCGTADVLIAATYFEFLAQAAGLGTTWLGMLDFLCEEVPAIRKIFNLPDGSYFYAMLFGKPAVKFARTAQRDRQAQFRELK